MTTQTTILTTTLMITLTTTLMITLTTTLMITQTKRLSGSVDTEISGTISTGLGVNGQMKSIGWAIAAGRRLSQFRSLSYQMLKMGRLHTRRYRTLMDLLGETH